MGLVLRDVLQYVVRPSLQWLDPEIPHSRGAELLLMGTALHESKLQWLDQTTPGPGPAYGIFQMEAATHYDLWSRFIEFRPALAHKLRSLRAPNPSPIEQLRTNLLYACAMARVLYFRSPERMPKVEELDALAALAKRVFNTSAGKATVDDYRRALDQCASLFPQGTA